MDGAQVYRQGFADGIRPDPDYTVSSWADAHRMLSQKASAEPGRWRTERTPYLQEIMDELSPSSPAETVAFMAGTARFWYLSRACEQLNVKLVAIGPLPSSNCQLPVRVSVTWSTKSSSTTCEK